jgi:hypothetical protein
LSLFHLRPLSNYPVGSVAFLGGDLRNPLQAEGAAIQSPAPHEPRRVVVVAGPSGAGKSAFMRHIATGQLPPEIQERLPAGVRRWVQSGHSRAELRLFAEHPDKFLWLATDPQDLQHLGLILPYDLTRQSHAYVEDYATDPMLEVVSMAREVLVINLRPEPDRLLRQWAYVRMGARTDEEINEKERAWRIAVVADWLARAGRRISPAFVRFIKRQGPMKAARKKVRAQIANMRKDPRPWLDTYQCSKRIDALFDRWQAFLATVAARGVQVRQIDLEPAPDAPIADHTKGLGESCGWRLMHRADP